jgi:hypothetical protein
LIEDGTSKLRKITALLLQLWDDYDAGKPRRYDYEPDINSEDEEIMPEDNDEVEDSAELHSTPILPSNAPYRFIGNCLADSTCSHASFSSIGDCSETIEDDIAQFPICSIPTEAMIRNLKQEYFAYHQAYDPYEARREENEWNEATRHSEDPNFALVLDPSPEDMDCESAEMCIVDNSTSSDTIDMSLAGRIDPTESFALSHGSKSPFFSLSPIFSTSPQSKQSFPFQVSDPQSNNKGSSTLFEADFLFEPLEDPTN